MKNVIVHLMEERDGTGKLSAVCINHPSEANEYLLAIVPVEPVNKRNTSLHSLPCIKMYGEEFQYPTRYLETNGPGWNGYDMRIGEACRFLNALKRSGEWLFADGTDHFKAVWDAKQNSFIESDFPQTAILNPKSEIE